MKIPKGYGIRPTDLVGVRRCSACEVEPVYCNGPPDDCLCGEGYVVTKSIMEGDGSQKSLSQVTMEFWLKFWALMR